MRGATGDWLEVIYRAGLDVRRPRQDPAVEIRVRSAPGLNHLSPDEVRRIRVTVSPSEPGQPWRLFLRDFGPGPGAARGGQVWWRAYPGTWQPLGGTGQCVAEGRGRTRVDVSVRMERAGEGSVPHLRFVAETS